VTNQRVVLLGRVGQPIVLSHANIRRRGTALRPASAITAVDVSVKKAAQWRPFSFEVRSKLRRGVLGLAPMTAHKPISAVASSASKHQTIARRRLISQKTP
jgi:hypothetical protein